MAYKCFTLAIIRGLFSVMIKSGVARCHRHTVEGHVDLYGIESFRIKSGTLNSCLLPEKKDACLKASLRNY